MSEPTVSVPFGSLPYTYQRSPVDKTSGLPTEGAWEPISATLALKAVRDCHDEVGGPKALLRGDVLRCGTVFIRAVRSNEVETPTPTPEPTPDDVSETPQPSQTEDLESLTKAELKDLVDARGITADRRSRASMIEALKENSNV